MDRSREELEELVQHANALRGALARMRSDLSAATAAEQALTAKLRALGVDGVEDDDAKTTVDPLEASGLPRRMFAPRAEAQPSSLRAAVVGAALVIGFAGVLLLAVNVLVLRRTDAPAAAQAVVAPTSSSPSATTAIVRDGSRAIPPPPPRESAEAPTSPPPSLASAVLPKNGETPPPSPAPTSGFLTVVCAPKCDAISDNNETLAPSSVVNLPVAAGSHKLTLGSANGVKKTLLVNVAPGQTREVRVSMDTPGRDYGF